MEIKIIPAEGQVGSDKILIEGHDISEHVRSYTLRAGAGELRIIELELISPKHLAEFDVSAEVIPFMELGGKRFLLVEEKQNE